MSLYLKENFNWHSTCFYILYEDYKRNSPFEMQRVESVLINLREALAGALEHSAFYRHVVTCI